MSGFEFVAQEFSSRMMASLASAPSRWRPRRTCSLKAMTRLVSSPPLVTGPVPKRMRLPLAPSAIRGGGWISAGMISTVQTPFPILAETAPKIWPHFCAPSPASETISIVCSARLRTVGAMQTSGPTGTATAVIGETLVSGEKRIPQYSPTGSQRQSAIRGDFVRDSPTSPLSPSH